MTAQSKVSASQSDEKGAWGRGDSRAPSAPAESGAWGQGDGLAPSNAANSAPTNVDDSRVLILLREYQAALEAGDAPNREDLLARFPEIADPLADCLDALEVVYRTAQSLSAGSRTDNQSEICNLKPEFSTLGDFKILRELGRGGMGIVYEAEQLSLGRRVALKVLPFAGLLDERALARFQNEARAAATLSHPNIVPIHYVGQDRGVHFYAMQLIEGQSLADVIEQMRESRDKSQETRARGKRAGDREHGIVDSTPDSSSRQLPTANSQQPPKSQIETQSIAALATEHSTNPRVFFRRVAELGIEIAQALQHAHEHGILHRDVKPANILLDAEGKAWITDFGLARLEADPSITATGDLVGTLRYMSPEQVAGRAAFVDHRTDVYSLGVTLYELMTLRPTFTNQDRGRLLREIAEKDPPPPRRLRAEIPKDLETIVLKSVCKDPHLRYRVARDLADDLQRLVEQRPITARRTSRLQRAWQWSRRNPALATLSSMLFAVLVFLAVAGPMAAYRQSQLFADAQRNLYIADVQRAYQEWYAGNVEYATQLLARNVPRSSHFDPRGFEWHYLWNAIEDSRKTVLHEHPSGVIAVAVSPDGSLSASAGEDAVIRLWNVRLRTIREIRGHTAAITAIAFSPDGKRLVSAGLDGTARFWSTETGLPAGPTLTHDEKLWALDISSDGQLVATGTTTGEITLWESDGTIVHRWLSGKSNTQLSGRQIWGLDFSPDSRQLAVAAWQEGACVVDVVTHETTLLTDGKGYVFDVIFSEEGSRILAASSDGLRVWDATTGEEVLLFRDTTKPVRSLAISGDGLLASGGYDGIVKIWDAATGQLLKTLIGHLDTANSIAFAPDGRSLFTASDDGTVRAWPTDAVLGARQKFGEDTQGWPTSIASSPSGKVYVITRHLRSEGPGSARIRVHDPAQSDEPLASVELEPALASERWSIDVAPDGRTFVVSRGGRLALWDCNSLREVRTICDDSKWRFSSLRFSPGSEFLAATANASGESCVFLWELPSWKKSKLELPSSNLMLAPLAFDSKGKCLAAGGNVEESDSVVHVWRKTSGEFQLDKPVLIHGEHNLTSLEFFRDGQSLAISGFNGVRLYELRTRQLRLLPRVTSASVTSMALAPNNAIIAAGGVGFIKLIDARTGDVAATIQIPTWAFSMDFLSDGKTLAVGGGDGQVYFLRARG